MTYTQNHHLPQWERADRIQMSDFNHAMSGIDSALTADSDETFDRLCRMAYNHWHMWDAQGASLYQTGLFSQSCASGTGVTASGMTQRLDALCAVNGMTALTAGAIQVTAKEVSQLNTTRNTAWALTFTPPASGTITRIRLRVGYNLNDPSVTHHLLFRLINQTTSLAEVEQDFWMQLSGSGSVGLRDFDVSIPVHAQVDYRLELQPVNTFSASIGIYIEDPNYLTVQSAPALGTTPYISRTFPDGEGCRGGLILVRYIPYGAGGSLRLSWLGREYDPVTVRNFIDSQGVALKEAEFRVSQSTPAGSEMRLYLPVEPDGVVCLYHWGGILL